MLGRAAGGTDGLFPTLHLSVRRARLHSDDLEGLRLNQIVAEIERSGFEVVRARKLEDAEIAVQTEAAIGCMVVDWGKKGLEGKTAA